MHTRIYIYIYIWGGRWMVGSSVVYCRRCGRARSSVVAWLVVAFSGRLRVLKWSKLSGDNRRPKFLSSVVLLLGQFGVVVASCRYCSTLSSIVVVCRDPSPRQCPPRRLSTTTDDSLQPMYN